MNDQIKTDEAMNEEQLLAEVKAKLIAEGYGGLYCDGECGCSIDELADCGARDREDGEEYMNGCDAGYKHIDPTRPDFFIISIHKEIPAQEVFDRLHQG